MKKLSVFFFISCLSFATLAQQTPPPPDPIDPPPAPDAPSAPEIEEVQRKLEEAQRRLEQAAREVAEHSAQLYQGHMPLIQKIRINRLGNSKGAMLGVHIIDAKDSSGNRIDSVQVVGVTPNGPADNAGIKNGDKIVAVNGQSLQGQGDKSPARQLLDIMAEVEPQEAVTLDYVRDGEVNSVIVEADNLNNPGIIASEDFNFDFDFDFDENQIRAIEDKVIVLNDGIKSLYSRFNRPWRDMELMALTPKLGSYFNTDKGILVVSIGEVDGLALEEGDVIVSIDGREPNDPAHAIRILNSYQPGETVNFEIMRERRKRTVEYLIPEMEEDVGFIWQGDNGGLNRWRTHDGDFHILPLYRDSEVKQIRLEKQDSI